jgi:hypothetical protein
MQKYIYLIFLFTICFNKPVSAQLSAADSTFLNSIFVEPVYINTQNYPGNWLWYKSVDSLSELYQHINDSYPFPDAAFFSAYNGIQINNMQADSLVNQEIALFNVANNAALFDSVKNPFRRLYFTLNNISAKSSAFFDSAQNSNPQKVFLVINGSGDNALTRSVINQIDYHNYNCDFRTFLKQYGDVYIAGTANEDQRAIQFNFKKLGRYYPNMPTYLQTYLNNAGTSMGYNKLIELVAWIKYLKSRYNEVIVLGLSTGGSEALWASLISEPHAALISSGYSILNDTDSASVAINNYFYPNIFNYFNKDSLLLRMAGVQTRFLFTLPQNDNAMSQLDIDSSYTQNFFASLNNVKHYYNYTQHSFPPCSAIDSFIHYQFFSPNNIPENNVIKHGIKLNNPFKENLYLEHSFQGKIRVTCYTALGQAVYHQTHNQKRISISTNHWAAGMYYLLLTNSSGDIVRQKIIKE